jgi:type I restriction enzyme S subunit
MSPSAIGGLIEKVRFVEPRRHFSQPEFSYIDLSSIDQSLKRITASRVVPTTEAPSRARQLVKAGDVLVSTVRPNLNGVAVVPDALDGAIASTGFCVLRAKSSELDGRYLFHWAKSPKFISDMVRKATGANYPAVSDRIIHESAIPRPPVTEQRRIATILDKAEELRAKRLATLALLDALPQAIFLELFGDRASILSGWRTRPLGSLIDFMTSGSRGWAAHYTETGDLFLRIQNVRCDELVLADVAYVTAPETAEAKRTRVRAGDVLLSITADLGRSAVVPDDIGEAYISQHLLLLRPCGDLIPRYLSAFLASPTGHEQMQRLNRGGVKAGLNFDDVRSIVVPLPPLDRQRAFHRRLKCVDSIRAQIRRALSSSDVLSTVLSDCAFAGEL